MRERDTINERAHAHWPGTSSGPCPSTMQAARTGAAARRPSSSGTANDHHVLTTLSVAPVAAPQPEHSALPVEFVIFFPFPQIVPPLLHALLQDRLISRNACRTCPCSVGEGRRGGQDGHAHQRDRFCIRCAPRGYGRAFDAPLGNTPTASRGAASVQAKTPDFRCDDRAGLREARKCPRAWDSQQKAIQPTAESLRPARRHARSSASRGRLRRSGRGGAVDGGVGKRPTILYLRPASR
jgi:hypothetical protein